RRGARGREKLDAVLPGGDRGPQGYPRARTLPLRGGWGEEKKLPAEGSPIRQDEGTRVEGRGHAQSEFPAAWRDLSESDSSVAAAWDGVWERRFSASGLLVWSESRIFTSRQRSRRATLLEWGASRLLTH